MVNGSDPTEPAGQKRKRESTPVASPSESKIAKLDGQQTVRELSPQETEDESLAKKLHTEEMGLRRRS
jgi:hypothetical protein